LNNFDAIAGACGIPGPPSVARFPFEDMRRMGFQLPRRQECPNAPNCKGPMGLSLRRIHAAAKIGAQRDHICISSHIFQYIWIIIDLPRFVKVIWAVDRYGFLSQSEKLMVLGPSALTST